MFPGMADLEYFFCKLTNPAVCTFICIVEVARKWGRTLWNTLAEDECKDCLKSITDVTPFRFLNHIITILTIICYLPI